LASEPNLVRAARTIQSWGPRILIIKRGEYGALLFAEGEWFSAAALPLESVQDPTGAETASPGAPWATWRGKCVSTPAASGRQ